MECVFGNNRITIRQPYPLTYVDWNNAQMLYLQPAVSAKML